MMREKTVPGNVKMCFCKIDINLDGDEIHTDYCKADMRTRA